MKKIDKNFYPGFTRKAITFTNDDGKIEFDKIFIEIVKPYGIIGTFNLCSPDLVKYTKEFYLDFYSGFGISNHCKSHPFAIVPGEHYDIVRGAFDASVADREKIHETGVEGLYHKWNRYYFAKIATYETYCRLIDEGKEEIEAVFGEGTVKSYVWPFCRQADDRILEYIKSRGYTAARTVGALRGTMGFSLPKDRMNWSYNADSHCLLEVAEAYDSYPDDGELKFFCFGVHSSDYVPNWDLLREFCKRYGNRKSDFWYSDVDSIFAYEDAVLALGVFDDKLVNESDITLYVKVDGEQLVLPPRSVTAI